MQHGNKNFIDPKNDSAQYKNAPIKCNTLLLQYIIVAQLIAIQKIYAHIGYCHITIASNILTMLYRNIMFLTCN